MKSNDNIPADELLLAEALAAARAAGARWTSGRLFSGIDGDAGCARTPPAHVEACCALGALLMAGHDGDIDNKFEISATIGNDYDEYWFRDNQRDGDWHLSESDSGESFGWAFRNAMEEP